MEHICPNTALTRVKVYNGTLWKFWNLKWNENHVSKSFSYEEAKNCSWWYSIVKNEYIQNPEAFFVEAKLLL